MRNALVLMNKDDFSLALSEQLNQNGFEVVLCHGVNSAWENLLASYFDIVIFDIFISDGDAVDFLQRCAQMKVCSMCLTEQVSDVILNACRKHGTDFVISKSLPMETIINRILFYMSADVRRFGTATVRDERNKNIVRMLDRVGIRHNRLGFKYAEQALRKMLECNNSLPICKIYQDIAQKEQTKTNCVERCIRSAIEEAWTSNSLNKVYEIFGYSVKADKGKPTNKEFLSAMYEKLRLNT